MKLAIHTDWILFLVMLSIFGVVLVTGTCLVMVFRRSAQACTSAACLSSAQKRQTWALYAMIIGLSVFGLAWVSFLMRYRLAQMVPAMQATPTFPRARNLLGELPPYNPLQGRTGDPIQIQAAVAAYFQSHPAIWKQPDEQGRTMLHWAAYRKSGEECKAILDNMPELLNQVDMNGDTPLIIAIEHGNLKAANFILSLPGHSTVQIQTPNNIGFTPLMYAAYFDNDDIAASILSQVYASKTEAQRTVNGVSALDIAERRKSLKVYARLLALLSPPTIVV